MACADVDMEIRGSDEAPRLPGQRRPRAWAGGDTAADEDQRTPALIQYYKATEMIPEEEGPLHHLLQKQPGVLGSVQVVSGLLSIGIGILFAVTQNIHDSLFALFRVSHMTGILFTIAGVLSNLLIKFPQLLRVSLFVNCGCIIVALIAAGLIIVDLTFWDPQFQQHLQLEVLGLCTLGFEVLLSIILCFWFSWQIKNNSG